MGNLLQRLTERQKKMLGWLALAAVLGMGILILQPSPSPSSPSLPSVEKPLSGAAPQENWERELELILERFLGRKGSRVFLTLERGPQLTIAYSSTEEERLSPDGVSEKRKTLTPVILRDDGARKETPLVLEEGEPLVRGVLVVLDWHCDPELRLQVAQAVQTVLQVPMYRIEVLFKE